MRDHDSETITITTDTGSDYILTGSMGDVTFDYKDNDTIDISSILTSSVTDTSGFDDLFTTDGLTITLNDPIEFEDTMPSVAKVEDMCNDYPALAQAYEKFKTIYAMVHQDWQGRQEENEPPF